MAYLGSGKACRNRSADRGRVPEVNELGQFVEAALSITSWVSGLFSFGGKPLTKAGKKLSELARRRGVDQKAADGWAREYEKFRDRECPGPKAGQPDTRRSCWAAQTDRMVQQLNPAITMAEWTELQGALHAGGFDMPTGWLPSNLAAGPGPLLPGWPSGPGGTGGPGRVLPAGIPGGPLGLLALGAALLLGLGKGKGRRR
jgi:hypothetical protein